MGDIDIATENLRNAILRQRSIDGRIQLSMNSSEEVSESERLWAEFRNRGSSQYRLAREIQNKN